MNFAKEKETLLQNYLETMKFLNDSTEETLYLCDISNGKVYFASDVSKKYHLPPVKDNVYDLRELQGFAYTRSNQRVFFNIEAFEPGVDELKNQEYCITNMDGIKFWVRGNERLQRDEDGNPMWIIGRISESALEKKMDFLTGMFNAEKMMEDLEEWLQVGKSGCLMVLGIDGLKNINHKYGRGHGNRVLRNVGEILNYLVEPPLRAYRLDGDKFAVNAVGCEREYVDALYVEIQEKLSSQCTVSSGVAEYAADMKTDLDTLYQHAENALDRAKKNGRNMQEFFSEDIYVEQLQMIEFQEELYSSVQNGFEGFSLCYQPQIDAYTYEIYGVEALLRWNSPSRGLISPNEFIPVLEQTRQICPVGEWVLREALVQCKMWRKTLPALHMSVNVSYVQLRETEIADYVLRLLDELDLPGEMLTLEITESIQLQDYRFFNKIFYKLEKHGVRIAIDDFGTGYSNLGYLKSIVIDEVKIDRSFVSGIQHSAYNYRLISNMIELARSEHIRVCCEGVETEAELQALKELYPNVLQGFLFAKPYTSKQFEEYYICEDSAKYLERKQKENRYRCLDECGNNEIREHAEKEKLLSIIDALEDLVYVRDQDNYELFYLNAAGREMTGAYDYKGCKCYEVLRGRTSPCGVCHNQVMKDGSYNVWETYNRHLQKHFLVKDRQIAWAGQIACLTVCLDITEKEAMNQKMQEKLEFEQNIVACTRLLIGEHDRNKAIYGVLALAGFFYEADRAYLFELRDDQSCWYNTSEWYAEGAEPQKELLQGIPVAALQRWQDQLNREEPIVVEGAESLREDCPEEYRFLKKCNVERLILVPVKRESEVTGFIGVDNPRKYAKDCAQLQMMAYLLEDRISKDRTRDRLKELLGIHYREILEATELGLWVIRISPDGSHCQMFADRVMLDIMGVKEEMTPEECYDYWYGRIDEGYSYYVNYTVNDAVESGRIVEIAYTWHHPVKGDVSVRCIGVRVPDVDGMICLEGYHREVNEVKEETFLPEATSIVFEYSAGQRFIYFYNDRSPLAGDKAREENFPECWLETGIVHPHFVSRFRHIFNNIQEQSDIEGEELLMKTEVGNYGWFQLKTRILYGEDQRADQMIVMLTPADRERAIKYQYMRMQDFYQASLSEKIAYMEVDLESRQILEAGGLWADYREEADGTNDYYYILTRCREALIHQEDIDAYTDFFGHDLHDDILIYENNTKKLQYRRILDGRMQWVELTAHVFSEQFSKSLFALIYLRNIDAQKRRELAQETAAAFDPLTGVYNRRVFEEKVTEHMATAEPGKMSALVLVDLDNFKYINDEFGHIEGDSVLKSLSDAMMVTFRKKDILGRLGGDEFFIFLKNVSDKDVIDRRMEELCASFVKLNKYGTTCSIGITMLSPGEFIFGEALRRADVALYRSKARGKNQYTYYEE